MNGSPQIPLRRPQNGSQAHDLSRELAFGRPAQVGATPFWDRRRAPFGGAEKKDKCVNQQPKSVTYVLNHECYLCIDCARSVQSSMFDVRRSAFDVRRSGPLRKACSTLRSD